MIDNKAMTTNEAINNKTWRKAIRCVETGVSYISLSDAARELNIPKSSISNVLNGRMKTAGGYNWEYLSEEETKALINAMEPKEVTIQKPAIIRGKGKSCNGNTNAVLCISTGEVYTSCTDAAMNTDVTVGQMSHVCRGNGYTAKGKRFCYVKDINEHIDEVAESIRKANMYDELMSKEEKRKELIFEVRQCEINVSSIESEIARLHDALKKAHEELEKAKENLMYFI